MNLRNAVSRYWCRLRVALLSLHPAVRAWLIKLYHHAGGYSVLLAVLWPVNLWRTIVRKRVVYPDSVLHISYMVHIPYYATRLLREHGMKADFLAMGGPGVIWNQSDYLFLPRRVPPLLRAIDEFRFFWNVVAKYEAVHSHFGIMMTDWGWELPLLKRLGRRIVINYRGCEIRDPDKNKALHPEVNICQECDYNAEICSEPVRKKRVQLAQKYGDIFLVTTPDMLDFAPQAMYFPFFLPKIRREDYVDPGKRRRPRENFKIVHVTGHPGIEGTRHIRHALDNLTAKGHRIEFVALHVVQHEEVLRQIADADLTIGKMKMGFYANAQIESLYLGVPVITWIRPEFMTDEIRNSGLIVSTLAELESTLEYYLDHPEELEKKRALSHESVLTLHNDQALARGLISIYKGKALDDTNAYFLKVHGI
jgi:hypothetical protein